MRAASPLADGVALILREADIAMNQSVCGVRHLALEDLVADFFGFVFTLLRVVVSPLRKIYVMTGFVDVVGDDP